jgi:excisionase family DNA binding protein
MNLLTTQQAAEILGVTDRRVRSLIAEGKLTAHRLGRDYAIEESDLALVPDRKRGRPAKSGGKDAQGNTTDLSAEDRAVKVAPARKNSKKTEKKARKSTKKGGAAK